MSSWNVMLRRLFGSHSERPEARKPRKTVRLWLEPLEDRLQPSAATVSPPQGENVAAQTASFVNQRIEQIENVAAQIASMVKQGIERIETVQQNLVHFLDAFIDKFVLMADAAVQDLEHPACIPTPQPGSGSGSGSGSSAPTQNPPNQSHKLIAQQSGSGSGSGSTTSHDNPSKSEVKPMIGVGGSGSMGSVPGCGSGSMGSGLDPEVSIAADFNPYPEESGICMEPEEATCTVSLSALTNHTVTVKYATQDDTAEQGVDYTYESDTLTFGCGQTSQTISIPILDDGTDESNTSWESFKVILSNPQGATLSPNSYFCVVNIAEGPQQQATDTLIWNPCDGFDASTVTNWYDDKTQQQLQKGAMGPNPSSPIIFNGTPNGQTPNDNSSITWDKTFTVASMNIQQNYTFQQRINTGVTVELAGKSGTALMMDGSSILSLNFLDKTSKFQIDNNATITKMALTNNVGGQFNINGGTTKIGLQSNGAPNTDNIGVQFNINAGATLQDYSYNALTFLQNGALINVYGTMNVAYGTGAGATLIDNAEHTNNLINVDGGTLNYLGEGGVTDTFNVPVNVAEGTFRLTLSAAAQKNGGKLIVKDLSGCKFANGSLESVYVSGEGLPTLQLAYGDILECDQDFYLDHGMLQTTDSSTCTIQDGAQGAGTAIITDAGRVTIGYDPQSTIYGELDVQAATLQFGGSLAVSIAGYDPTKQQQGQQDVLKVVGGDFNLNPQAATVLAVSENGSLMDKDKWIIISSNNITSSTPTIDFGAVSQTNLKGAANNPQKGQYQLQFNG